MKYFAPLALTAFALAAGAVAAAPLPAGAIKNVVLVHGSFADGSGWRGVADILIKDGYTVSVVQHPETSLADDVTAVKRVLAMQDGPAVLVGHSYGGAVITQAGSDPKVAALVYIAGMAPDEGEAAGALLQKIPAASKAVKPTADGYLQLDPAQFQADFAADLPLDLTRFMALSQVFTNGAAFGVPITNPAWKTKPTWAMVATQDRAINPELERFMYKRANAKVVEVKASHAVYISRPKETAALIERAATGK